MFSDTATQDKLLRAVDVAELLGVSRGTVYRWTQEGVLPVVQLGGAGGAMRYRRSDVDAAIERGLSFTDQPDDREVQPMRSP